MRIKTIPFFQISYSSLGRGITSSRELRARSDAQTRSPTHWLTCTVIRCRDSIHLQVYFKTRAKQKTASDLAHNSGDFADTNVSL